jgi:predicted transcriptional regulator of viral defense system
VATYKQMETFCLYLKMKESPIAIFRKHGGQLRMSEAFAHGITRYMLYSLRDKGIIEQVSRGVYRLMALPPISKPDLVTVSLRFPNAVVCLISALSHHNITTQIPPGQIPYDQIRKEGSPYHLTTLVPSGAIGGSQRRRLRA